MHKVRAETAILKTRGRATSDFGTFSAPLRLLRPAAKRRHTGTRMRVVGTRAQAAVYPGNGVWLERSRSHLVSLRRMKANAKKAAHRATAARGPVSGCERDAVPLLTPQLAGELREPYVMTKTEEMTPKSTSEM